MNINALIKNDRKRRRTSVGSVHINPSSDEENSGSQLEHHRKRRADCGGPVTVVTLIHSSPLVSLPTIAQASSPITINDDTPSPCS